MEKLWRDLVLALVTLVRSPLSTAVIICTLALGIGANTAIFSLLDTILLRALPVAHPEQLVSLATSIPDNVNGDEPFSWQMFDELRRNQTAFSDLFSWNAGPITNFEAKGRTATAVLATASGNYYSTLGIAPLLGRFIKESDVAFASGTSNAVAVISYRAWRRWYNGSPSVLGSTLRIEDRVFTVIGVEPEGYTGMVIDGSADVTVPLFAPGSPAEFAERNPRLLWLRLYGRLKPHVTLPQAGASLEALWPGILKATRPPGYEGDRRVRFFARRLRINSASTGISTLRKRFSQPLKMLMALVGTVLLVACLNLANLSLATVAARQQQSAVRASLGASRWDLIRPALLESLLLSSCGALIGLLLAYWSSRGLLRIAWTGVVETPLTPSLDYRVLGFTAVVTLMVGFLSAFFPAWYAASIDPISALRKNTRSVHGGSPLIGRSLLTVQVALSLILVMGALLFGKTLTQLYSADLGYRKDHLLTMMLFPQAGKQKLANSASYYKELAERVNKIPGVTQVSYSSEGPAGTEEFFRPVCRLPKADCQQAITEVVGPDFFATAGMKVLRGRDFNWDDSERKQGLVVISRSLADRMFGDIEAVGQDLYWGPTPYQERFRVIGVVNSARLWKVESVAPLALYRSISQVPDYAGALLDIRTAVDPRNIKTTAEKAVRSLGRQYSLRTMTVDERLNSYVTIQRLTALLATFFGGAALLIAAVGLYGLLSFQVARRTTELGIRMALGALRWQILASILREVLLVAGSGCVLGVAGSIAMRSYVASTLYGVSASDPVLLGLATLSLLTVAVLAGLVPAARAASVDPLTALRME